MSDRDTPRSSSVEDAAAWCLRTRSGTISASEQAALETWLEQSAENRAHFRLMTDIWEGAAEQEASIDFLALRREALTDLQSRKSTLKIRQGMEELWRWVNPRRHLRGLTIGACIIALSAGTLATWQAQATVYETDRGQTQVIQLTDGSVLRLDADTRLRVQITHSNRKIWLDKGRARLEVARNHDHALDVYVGDRRITAEEGELSVEHLGNQTAVTMLSGTATVNYIPSNLLQLANLQSDTIPDTIISSHEELISYDDKPHASVRQADPNLDDVWKNGLLAFDNEPIAVAIERVNRYAAKPVRLDRLSRPVRVSGIYRTGDIRAFVEGVCAVSNLHYHEENGIYKITD